MPTHQELAQVIWQIADLLRGPYRPPQYERVMLPLTVLRRFDSVLAPTKAKVLAEHERRKGRFSGDALGSMLDKAAGQRFHNRSPLDFQKLKGDPDHIDRHLVSYIQGFSTNVRRIFEYFEFEAEIEKMREANVLFLVVSRFASVDPPLGWPQITLDNKENRESVGKLCDMVDAEVLCVGHGDPGVRNGAKVLRHLFEGRRPTVELPTGTRQSEQ